MTDKTTPLMLSEEEIDLINTLKKKEADLLLFIVGHKAELNEKWAKKAISSINTAFASLIAAVAKPLHEK